MGKPTRSKAAAAKTQPKAKAPAKATPVKAKAPAQPAPKAKPPAKPAPKAKPPAKPAPANAKAPAKPAPTKTAPPARPAAPAATPPARPALAPLVRPPAPPPPAPTRPPPPAIAETAAELDVVRLCRYGERFGPHRLEIQPVATPLTITSGKIAVADASPGSAATRKGALVLARPLPPGRYRCTLSVVHLDGAPRVAAAVLHVGRGPVARWVIAHAEGKKPPRTPDDAPAFPVESGTAAMLDAAALGRDTPPADPAAPDVLTFTAGAAGKPAAYVSYWGLDAEGYPACLVTDFAVFSKKDWKAKPT